MKAVRWVAFIPAAVIGGLALYYAGILMGMFVGWFYQDTTTSPWAQLTIHAMSYGALGSGFVICGARTAPSRRITVAYWLSGSMALLGCLMLGLGLTYGLHWLEAIDSFALLAGSYLGYQYIKEETPNTSFQQEHSEEQVSLVVEPVRTEVSASDLKRAKRVSLSLAVPGWEGELIPEAVERVAFGVSIEQERLRGNRFLVVVRTYELDIDGIFESIEIVSGHADLNDALARAQTIGSIRLVEAARKLDGDTRSWKHEVPSKNAPEVRSRWKAKPVFSDRLSDGTGWNAIEVAVAVLPTDPDTPINVGLVNALDMTPELVAWFGRVAKGAQHT